LRSQRRRIPTQPAPLRVDRAVPVAATDSGELTRTSEHPEHIGNPRKVRDRMATRARGGSKSTAMSRGRQLLMQLSDRGGCRTPERWTGSKWFGAGLRAQTLLSADRQPCRPFVEGK